jgi:hypothetical protein
LKLGIIDLYIQYLLIYFVFRESKEPGRNNDGQDERGVDTGVSGPN